MKQCSKCKEFKEVILFAPDNRTKSGIQATCRKCANDFRRMRYNTDAEYRERTLTKAKIFIKENPEVTKNGDLIRHHGITLTQYKQLFEKQNGNCVICNKPETVLEKRNGKLRSLAVDHDHKTGKIRGLLCSQCNRSLGGFQDNIQILKTAIKYLESNT